MVLPKPLTICVQQQILAFWISNYHQILMLYVVTEVPMFIRNLWQLNVTNKKMQQSLVDTHLKSLKLIQSFLKLNTGEVTANPFMTQALS
jgi:hypothetical protein